VRLVKHLMSQGNAQCILGNHELNIIRGDRKHGNHWFFGEPEVIRKDKFSVSFQILADESFRSEVVEFFSSLPIALEREDVGVVHACWDPESIEILRNTDTTVAAAFDMFNAQTREKIATEAITDPDQIDMIEQNENPIKVVSSGKEVPTAVPFFAGERCGTWRGTNGGRITTLQTAG